ncbi:hypothetical protein Tco_1138844, partial [Tanacetum coccineum]
MEPHEEREIYEEANEHVKSQPHKIKRLTLQIVKLNQHRQMKSTRCKEKKRNKILFLRTKVTRTTVLIMRMAVFLLLLPHLNHLVFVGSDFKVSNSRKVTQKKVAIPLLTLVGTLPNLKVRNESVLGYDMEGSKVDLKRNLNVVRYASEIIGSTFNYISANDFNKFLNECSLYDLPLGGHAFNRISSDGEKLSRLDRDLISDNLAITFPNMHATTMDRIILDHRAIILQHSDMDFGPIPFKLFNSWLQAPDFSD